MGMNKQELLGKKNLTDFEKRWLADRNVAHPSLTDPADVPEPGDVGGDSDDATDDTDAFVPEQLPAYEDMSQADLQAEAQGRGLPKSGSKAELIARLQKHDDENSPE